MESLQINTGLISLEVLDDNGDKRGTFKFNPTDTKCAERLFNVYSEFEEKSKEYEDKIKNANDTDKIHLLNELIDYFRERIDFIFGDETSQLLFGNAHVIDMFESFFVGITPYYENVSKQKTDKYLKDYE